jgi:hypothetical protein
MTYKVTFILSSAEEAFALFARLLPMEHVSVEEVGGAKPRQLPKVTQLPSPLRKKTAPRTFNPDAGINRIILTHLAKRPHSVNELRAPLKANGFSPGSVSSRIAALRERNLIASLGDGRWTLVNEQSNAT